MSARVLIAVADDETARRAAATAREAEFEVADIIIDPDELHRALRRLDVDVVLLHDALGGIAGARPRPRAGGAVSPRSG